MVRAGFASRHSPSKDWRRQGQHTSSCRLAKSDTLCASSTMLKKLKAKMHKGGGEPGVSDGDALPCSSGGACNRLDPCRLSGASFLPPDLAWHYQMTYQPSPRALTGCCLQAPRTLAATPHQVREPRPVGRGASAQGRQEPARLDAHRCICNREYVTSLRGCLAVQEAAAPPPRRLRAHSTPSRAAAPPHRHEVGK